jgi:hypothetical protein
LRFHPNTGSPLDKWSARRFEFIDHINREPAHGL